MILSTMGLKTSLFPIAFCVFTGVMTVSCKKSMSEILDVQTTEYKKVKPKAAKTWVFNWTDYKFAASNPVGYIKEIAEQGRRENPKLLDRAFPSNKLAGYGIYFAGDPDQSKTYGSILVVGSINPASTFGFLESNVTALRNALINGTVNQDIWGMYYLFGAPAEHHYAIATTSKEAINNEDVSSIDLKNPAETRRFSELGQIEQSLPVNQLIKKYDGYFRFVEGCRAAARSSHRSVRGDTLSTGARIQAILTEYRLQFVKRKPVSVAQGVSSFSNSLRSCDDAQKNCLDDLSKSLLTSAVTDKSSLQDAVKLSQELGYLPAQNKPDSPMDLFNHLFKRWDGLKAATDLCKAAEQMDATIQEGMLDTWVK